MAKPENDDTTPEKQQTWGTWEELLLACAVHRHGTDSWNSVSSEIQKRTTNLRSLTASDCRNKYTDLKCRFTQELGLPESVAEISTVPWLEDLRKLRVDELRREVEQYDLSISSLQSKVKKLEEEREISLNELDTEIENSPDLDKIVEKKEHRRESVSDSAEPVVPKPPITSVNGSISPDPKEDSPGTGSENAKRDEEMVGLDDGGEAKLAGEDSCRGSCEGVEKESAENSERVEPGRRTELTESMAESEGGGNGGDEGGKETSDVQSSASLPRKGTSEPENEDQSPSTKDLFPVESQPSISFVEILLSNPCGSHFSRRLETQETLEYSKIIREHIDLEIIRKRVEEGWYKSSMNKLFRDLLLLINNARFFYPKKTSEFNFAVQLNELVKKQITTTTIKKKPKEISPPKANSCLELVPFVETVNTVSSSKPVSSKPRMSVPIVACRKRSSLATKPLPPGSDKKDETFGEDDDDKSLVSKKMTRGRTTSTKKVAIRNVKNRDSGLNVDEVKKTDEEKKGSNKSGSSKKKSAAASFLKRMRVGSSSSDTLVETLKPSSATDSSSTGKGGAEQRKNKSNNSNKAGAKKRATTTGKNQTSPVKKNNGRAMKRVAAPSSSSPILGKRSREAGHEKEGGSYSSTRLKKRVRR
ncbi:unnamed protein product [Arabis nemorensis]|uniref:Bromo domain-containing protein n=1 Tax=Arabis nemorensis TaxID=586526 RepID=A0A565BN58_9BRAS|nr:unnamed protein product [Arabis nemorensis]